MHQNIKSENIFVKYWEIFFHIKLADFELFKNISFLKIICELLIYLASEIQKKCYDNKIDIWSLKVVELKYTDDFSCFYSAVIWHKSINVAACCLVVNQQTESMFCFLIIILQIWSEQRSSAEKCFQKHLSLIWLASWSIIFTNNMSNDFDESNCSDLMISTAWDFEA